MTELPDELVASIELVYTREDYLGWCDMSGEEPSIEGFEDWARDSMFEYLQCVDFDVNVRRLH